VTTQDSFEERYSVSTPLSRHIEVRDFGWANILPAVLEALPTDGHFLDVGSGTGVMACLVAAQGLRVTALDRAPSGVRTGLAQARALGVTGVTFRQWDLDVDRDLPVEGPIDIAFASEILEHVKDDLRVLCRVRDCLAPSARLIATSPSVNALMHRLQMRMHGIDRMDVARHHLRRYSEDSLRALAEEAGFGAISVRPIAGVVRDCFFGSRLGLRASRYVKRPITPLVQRLDGVSIPLADSQLLLTAVVP
jgi:SAM-dependent methyltransferase